jgi:hypothetical protein
MVADSEAHSSLSPMDLSESTSMVGGKGRRKARRSGRKSGKKVKVVGGKRKSSRKRTGRNVRKAKKSRMTMKMW